MSQRDLVEHRAGEVARQLANLKRLYRGKLSEDPFDEELVSNLAVEIERLQGEFDRASEELASLGRR